MPSTTQPRPSTLPACSAISAAVVSTAIAMPTMPNRLPRIEVVGCDRPFKAWMKQTDATRYSSVTRFMDIIGSPPGLPLRVLRAPPQGGPRLRAVGRRSCLAPVVRAGGRLLLFLLEHFEHAPRQQKAAEDVEIGRAHV